MEDLLEEIISYVGQYMKKFGKCPSAVIVNRRYGVRMKKLTGKTVLSVLKENPNIFAIEINESGGNEISLVPFAEQRDPVEEKIVTYLQEGPLTSAELMNKFKDSGLRASDVMNAQFKLNNRGKIATTDGLISLV